MQRAKDAIASMVSHDGKHKTTVDETVHRAVTEEHVQPQQHEEIMTAVDKEVHQDHHHTTVQPIKAKEVLPEQHVHNSVAVQHKTFNHGDDREVKAAMEREAAKYKDTSVTHETIHTKSTAPVVTGERVHHHVHEHVQPVMQKEVIAPKVVHTTIPVHETHHAAAQIHGTSILPATTLEEFQAKGGALDGRSATKLGEFDRCPKPYNKDLQREQLPGDKLMHSHSGSSSTHEHARSGSIGDMDEEAGQYTHTSTTRQTRNQTGAAGQTRSQTGTTSQSRNQTGTSGQPRNVGQVDKIGAKPSMMDKLNPFKDADNDGKKGVMT